MVDQRGQFGQQVRIGQFAAQVDQVVGAEHAGFLPGIDGGKGGVQGFQPHAFAFQIADGQGIQHGGDAGRHALCIVGDDCRQHRPQHAVARHQVFFQIVGMDLHQAGNQVIPAQIHTAPLRQRLLVNGGNHPVDGFQRPTLDHAVSQDQAGMVEQLAHAGISSSRTSGTVNRRSATAVRVSSSWKMPTSAAPRALASFISAITT